MLERHRECNRGDIGLRHLAEASTASGFSVAGIPGGVFCRFQGLGASAEEIESLVVEGRGDDVLAIGFAERPDSPEDGSRPLTYLDSGQQRPFPHRHREARHRP